MKSFSVLRSVPWEYPEQIAVVVVKSAKAFNFLSFRYVTFDTVSLGSVFRNGHLSLGSALGQDTAADTVYSVVIAEVSGQPHETVLVRRSHRNILADLDFIPALTEVIEKLTLRHGLSYYLIHIGTDNTSPRGSHFLFGSPFSVML